MSEMADLYEAVYKVLKGTGAITAFVPAANIRPSEDVEDPPTGNMIYYGWSGGRWDRKKRRGEGSFEITVAVVDNKIEATEVMDLVRAALTPKALTAELSGVKVSLFSEEDAFTDAGTTASNRFQAATVFSVKMVEAA